MEYHTKLDQSVWVIPSYHVQIISVSFLATTSIAVLEEQIAGDALTGAENTAMIMR